VLVEDLTFPLVPRDRLLGLAFGAMQSARRGIGSDVAGSRPYQPGDDVDTIDWHASARLSAARGSDEFIVRERFAEEAPRVVIVSDRRAAMSAFPESLPWLSKPRALAAAEEAIAASAARARGLVGYLDFADGSPAWRPPRTQARVLWPDDPDRSDAPFGAPADNLTRAFAHLTQSRRSLPPGTFVFVLSDFLVAPSADAWLGALAFRWDVVPVVIQDPTWEQSFPLVDSIGIPIVDAATGRRGTFRLRRGEARRRRDAHERRLLALLEGFLALQLDAVVIGSAEPEDVLRSFLAWADARLFAGGRQWQLGA
jgi:uncharacterized protein (DUF58 family)